MSVINIAVDGPASAGKSTVCKMISKEFGFIHIDTGALYRAVGIYALRKGKDTTNEAEVKPLLDEINLELKFVDNTQRVFLNGEDVSDEIRTPPASMAASNVSALPSVRQFLLNLQRDIAKHNNIVMDGRDIGTVILPNADIKIFLVANSEERAKRRYEELKAKGFDVKYDDLLSEIKLRDQNDSSRKLAPLKPAEDAIIFDNSGFMPEQTAKAVIEIIRSKLNAL